MSAPLSAKPPSKSISASLLPSTPVITSYSLSANCISPRSTFLIIGRNFGKSTGKKIVMGGKGANIRLNVLSWRNTQIKVRLPLSSKAKPGQRYYIGIRQVSPVKWLSNINKTLMTCVSPTQSPNQQLSPVNTLAPTSLTPLSKGLLLKDVLTPSPNSNTKSYGNGSNNGGMLGYGSDGYYYEDTGGYTENHSGQLMGSGPPSDFAPLSNENGQEDDPENIEPGEIITASASMGNAQALAQQVASMGLHIKRRKSLASLGMVITVFRTTEGTTASQTLTQLHETFPKIWMDVNHRFNLQGARTTRHYAYELIHWHKAVSKCTSGLRLGMVDAAVDSKHPALQGAAIQTHAFIGRGMVSAASEHGTAIASLMIGQEGSGFTGIAPQAQLYAAEVFRQRDDSHTDATVEQILIGLNWLAAQRVRVINLSFGGSRDMLLELGLRQLMKQGISIVAAAGNGGLNSPAIYPAAQKGVIAVTAVDAKSHLYRQASQGTYVDFSAPGVDLWAASGKGRYVSGTSYATPFITIAIALAGANSQQSNSKQLLRFLKIHTTDLGESGKDSKFGWGIINFEHICDTKLHQ
ncbi:MAG: S8 family serine peptidase [Mariprofundaceae bacterium]|nr:S8 family serine peptidase [Mariprofundaceae bacterium]